MRPTAVLLTGVPGSGKTTVGTQLARHLRVPFLARDDVRGGLFFSAGAWRDDVARVPTSDEAVEAFLAAAEALLERGVSCVLEYVVRRHRPADLERLVAVADVVVVRLTCAEAAARFVDRNRTDALVGRGAVLRALGFDAADDHTAAAVARNERVAAEMTTAFSLPILDVDTSAGSTLDLDPIVAFVTR